MVRRDGGGKRGNDNGLAIIAGSVAAAIMDYFWNTTHLYGYNDKIGTISSKGGKKVGITAADYAQVGLSTILGMYGFMKGGAGSRIPAFAFGMATAQIITKFVFPTAGVARYIIYDVDAEGRLVPTRTFQ